MGAALVAGFVVLLVSAVSGLPTLSDAGGDNDSLLRLVQVRDLVAGQSWFDLHQYRMGLAGGFEMHWSRLVDAPVAATVVVVGALTGSTAAGETAALVLWPLLLFTVAVFLILRCARAVGGDEAMLPALVLGAAALHFGGLFAPGAIDHHNVQIVLSLGMIAALLGADERGGAAAGACAALMVAVGMETMPYLVAAGVFLGAGAILGGESERRSAIGFGLAFAAVCAAAFVGTVSPGAWGAVRCDALSIAHLAIAALSGAGLAAAAAFTGGRVRRAAALLALAAVVAAVVVVFFPQCLGSPYAGLDPDLEAYWMSMISEAQPLWTLIRDQPGKAVNHYVTPMLALAVVALDLARRGMRRGPMLVGLLLLTAVLVSIWQVRGAMFSVPFGAIPLAAWVGSWRRRASHTGKATDALRMAAAWLISLNVAWTMAAVLVSLVPPFSGEAAASAEKARKCRAGKDYDMLAALPPGGVLSVANLGAPILRYTPHRVLAGLYHRNVEANLVTLSAFTGTADGAEALVREQGLAYVVLCPGDDETAGLAEKAPTGFIASLLRDDLPPWLEPVAPGDEPPLRIYRVLPRPAR
ncbi:GtrA family protein [Mesorhizobium sp. L-8-3]|uniref:GtrA family protein n=1 Tax=Mesorhizobium sp. L-8-3 TaxID=2744522 RepID=UPI00192762B0|nr:GtrA family protein [Mesorhizobium sp. L-8-3]